jgi:hypothetical protein
MICLSHTHASPAVQSYNASKPGGHLIAPYLQHLRTAATKAATDALSSARPATLTWRYGTCDLATNRDLPAPPSPHLAAPLAGRVSSSEISNLKSSPSLAPGAAPRILCGFNPAAPADHTLLVGRITDPAGAILATIVNYACHPTTLAWENPLISPDYVGALRETVEHHTAAAPCLFLQGASGELASAEQYTADPSVADRHGRRLAFATLATLEAMSPPNTTLTYTGVVESGAPLAIWRPRPAPAPTNLSAEIVWADLPLKPLDPAPSDTDPSDPVAREKIARRRAIRQIVGDGPTSRMPLYLWRLGDSFLLGQQNEAYSPLQTQPRARHPHAPIAVMNLVNGSGGYLPPADVYDTGCYQVSHTPFAAGSLERLVDLVTATLSKMNP